MSNEMNIEPLIAIILALWFGSYTLWEFSKERQRKRHFNIMLLKRLEQTIEIVKLRIAITKLTGPSTGPLDVNDANIELQMESSTAAIAIKEAEKRMDKRDHALDNIKRMCQFILSQSTLRLDIVEFHAEMLAFVSENFPVLDIDIQMFSQFTRVSPKARDLHFNQYTEDVRPTYHVQEFVWVNYYGKWSPAQIIDRKQQHEDDLYYWDYAVTLPELAGKRVCEHYLSKYPPNKEASDLTQESRGKKDE